MLTDTSARGALIAFAVTEDWYFVSHRLALAERLLAAGYRVVVLTNVREHGDAIRAAGIDVIPHSFGRDSRGVAGAWQLARSVRALRRELDALNADVVHGVGIVPILATNLALVGTTGPAVVNAFAGLGFVFRSTGARARVLRSVIRPILGRVMRRSRSVVIVQNGADAETIVHLRLADAEKVALVRGAGVDEAVFRPSPEPTGAPVVAFVGRLLWDKGVGEFVAAARELRARGVEARFVLIGSRDAANPACVPAEVVEKWRDSGDVEFWGRCSDMPAAYEATTVVVLPSYHEGLPKVLLEAGASARAVVATEIAGCREVVEHGANGLLVPVGVVGELTRAIERLLGDAGLRQRLAARNREVVVERFTSDSVAQSTIAIYRSLLAAP